MRYKNYKNLLSVILSLCLIIQMSIPLVYAEDNGMQQGSKTITAFEDLAENIKNITVAVNATEDEAKAKMPSSLNATYVETTTGSALSITLENITWELDESKNVPNTFDSTVEGAELFYKPIIPAGYTLADGLNLPQIKLLIGADINSPDTSKMTTLSINKGNITIGDGTVSGFDASGAEITTANSNGYIIVRAPHFDVTKYTITVSGGTHNIVLRDVSLYLDPGITNSPFSIESGAKVNLILEGSNYLRNRSDVTPAGIRVPEGAELIISKDSTGKVITFGGPGAGIGGNANENGGTITINGGEINTSGGTSGAGIGGGRNGSGGIITINGGNITNAMSSSGAGIGGGLNGSGGIITINGGNITNAKSSSGAGIGSGENDVVGNTGINEGTITINGGTINAQGSDGAGIGGGSSVDGGSITINAGEVTATSNYGAGIGGGSYGFKHTGGTITITGGTVTANAINSDGTGIGNGFRGGDGGTKSGGTLSSGGKFVYINANRVNADTSRFKGIINNDGNTTIYGSHTLTEDTTIAVDKKLTISNVSSLKIPSGKKLTVNGTLINNGTLSLDIDTCLTGTDNTLSGDGEFKVMGDPTSDMIVAPTSHIYNGTDLADTVKSAIYIDTTKIGKGKLLNHDFQVIANSTDGWILSIAPEVVKEIGNYTATFTKASKTINAEFSVIAAEATGSVVIESTDTNNNNKLDSGDIVATDLSSVIPTGGTANYQWKKTVNGLTKNIGTNQASYTLTSSDIRGKIFCEVTFTGNTVGAIASNNLDIAKEILTGSIVITGENTIGSELQVSLPTNGELTGSDYEVQWYHDNVAISGANAPSYKLKKEDLGKTLKAVIKAKETSEGFTGTLTSNEVMIPATAPDKAVVSASTANSYVTLSWTKPFANGSDITGYSLTVKQGEAQITGSPFDIGAEATSYKVENLTNSTEYTFVLSTINAQGITASDSVTAKPQKASDGGGSTGGGSSSGGSSGGGGAVTPTAPTNPAKTTPEAPTKVSTEVAATVTEKTASIAVSKDTVSEAIKKAQEEAKKNANEKNGIVVELKADTKDAKIENISAKLAKESVAELVKEGVKELSINAGEGKINLDLETLKTIQKQAGSDVSVEVKKVDTATLSAEAKAVIGNRPVYDFSITGENGQKVTKFGDGKISVSLPYILGETEKAEDLTVYYIDDKGNLKEMKNVVYDEKTKTISFTTDHFSKFAVGKKRVAEEAAASPKTGIDSSVFTDIANHWAKDDIAFVTQRGLFGGTAADKFSPNMPMTRGMFVTVLGRLANADVSGLDSGKFADVKTGSYYAPYVEWANKNNIISGTAADKFSPNTPITREQMAAIIANYSKFAGVNPPKLQSDEKGVATRAQVSAVLRRYIEFLESQKSN